MQRLMSQRFRGFLPVIVDVETGGFNAQTDALLEIAVVPVQMNEQGKLHLMPCYAHHIIPFTGAHLDPAALEFNHIDPYHPFRFAISEKQALLEIFQHIRGIIKANACQRAVLVGHNPAFDLAFLNAAVNRCHIKRNPFHPFTTFDTATLGGLAYGQTVLARAAQTANIPFDCKEAHSAIYDAERTAELFCTIVNRWNELGGWKEK